MDFLAAYLFTWLKCSALGFHSFTLQGNDLGCVDRWLALLSVSLGRGKLPCLVNFLYGLKLREMPCFKGFRGLSITKAKKSFIH